MKFTAFDNTFTDITFVSYEHNGTVDKIVVKAFKNDQRVDCTFEFTHTGFTGPMFKEGSAEVENDVFSMEIIGNCNSSLKIVEQIWSAVV